MNKGGNLETKLSLKFTEFSKRLGFGDIKISVFEGDVKPDMLRQSMSLMRGRFADLRFALVAVSRADDKPTIALFLSQPLVDAGMNAGAIVKSAAKHIQGGGGGQPWLAMAGGRNLEGTEAAKQEMLAALRG